MTSAALPSVAFLTSAPAPYRIPFLNELANHCRLLVAFDTRVEAGREWAIDESAFKFQWMLTKGVSLTPGRTTRIDEPRIIPIPLNVIPALARFRPDVVISSELGARTASAAAFCAVRRRPLIVWWEGTPHTEQAVGPMNVRIRKALLRCASRAWGNGQESATLLTDYGLRASRIDLGMTGIDTTRWRKDVDDARVALRASTRADLGLEGVVLLFAGGLSRRKGVQELLAAFSLLAGVDLPPWSALFVGSGPLLPEIEDWRRLHSEIPVARTGFVQPSELATYFAAADVFVMPSVEDVWGMVCLEALVAGLPQVTSSLAGAASSIVTTSEVGAVVDPRDARSLAHQLADRIRTGSRLVPEALRDDAMVAWSPEAMTQRAMASIRSLLGDTE